MSTPRSIAAAGILCGLLTAGGTSAESPALGRELGVQEVVDVDFVVMPDGEGLPPGSGTAETGEALYQLHCASCHGSKGREGMVDALAGGEGTISGPVPEKTVGSYWPYATTLFDYVRRAMPYQNPGSLTNEELYSITAYVLYLNDIVGEGDTIDAETLPKVKMPNRENFVWKVDP